MRKRSVEWQQDLSVVERLYAADWLVQALFDHPVLAPALVLRGGSALRYAYFEDYLVAEEPEFLSALASDRQAQWNAFKEAAERATAASGVKYLLLDLGRGMADFDYTGPLGRRSAAQPRVHVTLVEGTPRASPARGPLIHRFSDACVATVSAVALEEVIAERIVALSRSTARARDTYDLWFALTHVKDLTRLNQARNLANTLMTEKRINARQEDGLFEPGYAAQLGRGWEAALKNIPRHPAFSQVQHEIEQHWNKGQT